MKRILLALFLFGALTVMIVVALRPSSAEPTPLAKLKTQYAAKPKSSVDHSLFPQLRVRFAKPQDVTAACISCHNGRAVEVMRSSHWNWERTEYVAGQGIRALGKKDILNNFCIGVSGNEQSCNRCHIGYGYADSTFDFKNPLNVDCLACHDNSGKYAKAAGGAGMPDPTVDLSEVAQHVGKPQRANCGTCHFFGGGGNNVKHGDLESALFDGPRTVDVHMGFRRGEHGVRRLPHGGQAPDAREDVLGVVDEPEPGGVRALPWDAAARRRRAEQPHAQGGVPDLPRSGVRQGESRRSCRGTGRPPAG